MIISVFEACVGAAGAFAASLASATAGVGVKLSGSRITLPFGCFGIVPYGKRPSTEVASSRFLNWRRSLKTLRPFLRAEPLLQAAEELRAPRLVAAALAHELALERVEGVDVVARPWRDCRALRGAVVVDPRDEDVDVVQDRLALGPRGLEHLGLLRDLGLGLGAGGEVLRGR